MELGTVIFLVAVVALVVWRLTTLNAGNRRNTTPGVVHTVQQAAQPAAHAPHGNAVIAWCKDHMMWLLIAGVVIAAGIAAFTLWGKLPSMPSNRTLSLWAGGAVIVVLFVLGLFGKAGNTGAWVVGGVAFIAFLFLAQEFFLWNKFGTGATEVRRVAQEQSAARELSQARGINANQSEYTMRLTTEWSQAVRTRADQCIRWWTVPHSDTDTMSVQIRGINNSNWINFRDWYAIKLSGKITYNPGWYRFRALNGTEVVHYALTPRAINPSCE
jgi:hypothetical protein